MPATAERVATTTAFDAAFAALRADPALAAGLGARDAAFKRFQAAGLPTTREEEWRFTNVAPVGTHIYRRAEPAGVTFADLGRFRLAGLPVLVIVNGRYLPALSDEAALPAGVTVRARAEGGAPRAAGAFLDLNAAFYEQVLHLSVARGVVVPTAIQVLAFVHAEGHPVVVAPRLVIEAGERAEVTVVEDYAGLGAGPTLTTARTEVILEPGAIVRHAKIQREASGAFHLASLQAHLARASTFSSTALTFGAHLHRDDIGATLAGEGAECTLHGLYVATGHRLVDTHTTIDHAEPHCPSHEIYKGILAGHARAIFNGKIVVRPQAQKTDAKQTNKALLLSDDAQIDTKPQLEIFADDVKCTHGAAIGQLDEDALFYLRARGVAEDDARHMLIEAFAGQIIDGVAVPAARDLARTLLEATLGNGHG